MNEDNISNEMNNSEISFDNLVILKEFSNILDLVGNDEFLQTVPKAKLKRVKWIPMFNCLKQGIVDEMIVEMNSMWASENLPQKLEILQKQQSKYSHLDTDTKVWRPQLGNVSSQLKAHDVANLQKQKKMLENLAKEYEVRVSRSKKTLSAKRGYIRALQMDVQKYQKKNEKNVTKITEKLQNHQQLTKVVITDKPDIDKEWSIKDFDDDMKIENA